MSAFDILRQPNEPQGQSLATPFQGLTDPGRANVFTVTFDTALEKEEFNFGGVSLWAIAGTANCEVFLGERQGQGVPWSVGQRLTGLGFDKLLISGNAQAGESLTFLVSATAIDVSQPANIVNNIETNNRRYDYVDTDSVQAITTAVANETGLLFSANANRRAVLIQVANFGTSRVITLKRGSAPADAGDGYPFRWYSLQDMAAQFEMLDNGETEIYYRALNSGLEFVALEGVIG